MKTLAFERDFVILSDFILNHFDILLSSRFVTVSKSARLCFSKKQTSIIIHSVSNIEEKKEGNKNRYF